MPTQNYAKKYASQVDERFSRASQAALALNNDYSFSGVQTVVVYSIDTVDMNNYSRSGTNRYGTPTELGTTTQELTVTRDRSFAFTIDRGNKTQSMMVTDAGKALARQVREKVVPEYDAYVFRTLAKNAGGSSTTAPTAANAYQLFLTAQEALGDANVPDSGRVCFCSYAFYNLMKQNPSFIRYGDASQRMLERGILGTVDGVRLVAVPKSRLPATTGTGAATASFILTHPCAACGPKQLETYKIHDEPPGLSGWLCEGRILYDCFVLNNKKGAIWYQGPTLS